MTGQTGRIQKAAGIIAIAIGMIVLAGWLLDIPQLARLHPDFVMMKINASVGFILLGAAVYWEGRGTERSAPAARLAGAVAALGVLTTLEWITGWNPGFDQWLARDLYSPGQTGSAGRMSIMTSISFSLLGLGLVLNHTRLRLRYWVSQGMALVAWLFALTAFTGYIYQVAFLLGAGSATSISPHAAFLLVLLSSACLAGTSDEAFLSALTRGGPGSFIFRQQLLPLLLLTLTLGGLRLWGERAGLYPTAMGTLFFGLAMVVSFLVIGWRNSRVLNRSAEQVELVRRELERKNQVLGQSEARLREADEKLGFALESGGIGVLDWVLKEDRVQLSEIGMRLFGRTDQPLKGLIRFGELERQIHPDDQSRFRSELERAMHARTPMRLDFRIIRPDGALRWLHLRGQAVYGPREVPERFTCALNDITRRKTEENRISEILASITSGFIALDRDWKFTFVNPGAEQLLGVPRERLIGTDFRDLSYHWAGSDAAALEESCRQAMDRGAKSVLELRDPRSGSWHEARVHPAESGLSIVFDDITERRRAEESVRRSEAKFRRLVESNLLGIFTYHSDGKVIEANDAFLRLIGYSREELGAGKIRWRDLTPPEWSALDREAWQQLDERGYTNPYEKEFLRKDGRRMRVYIGAVNFEGSRSEGIAYLLDVTERHRLLESEREHRQRAEAAIRARDDMVAMVSHDLKNPIGAVMINAQLLLRKPKPPDAVIHRAEAVLQASRRMDNLVRDILNVARIESGTFAVELYREEVRSICREALELLEPLARARGLQLHAEFPEECCPSVAVDRETLLQVLSNLIGNSIKFTPQGGEIRLRARNLGDRVLFSVVDTGRGIESADLEHVFDRFWQSPETRRKGTGLGLAIVKGIVEAHGGQVCVESRPGEGAAFYFTLLTPEALPASLRPRFHDRGTERASA